MPRVNTGPPQGTGRPVALGRGGRRRLAVLSAVAACLVVVSALGVTAGSNVMPAVAPPPRLVSVRVSHYYGGAMAAFIFRVDDFTVDPAYSRMLPDNTVYPTEWFYNYEDELISHITSRYPWLRVTAGIITVCHSGGCGERWRLYASLARLYGWELASHSRYHVRPPRSPSDYLGSLSDIEGNVTGYRVLTYIEPFGQATRGEVSNLYRHGVRVVATTTPEPPMPPDLDDGAPWLLGFTVKASDSLPWRSLLATELGVAILDGGVVVVYTHATSYDWRSPQHLLGAIDYIASTLEHYRGLVWVTTPGELYSYIETASRVTLNSSIEGNTLVVDVSGSTPKGLWRIPVTIEVDGLKESWVRGVYVDGSRLEPLGPGIPSIPRAGYSWASGRLLVSVYPPSRILIKLSPEARVALAPQTITATAREIGRARLAAYTIWLPFAAVLYTAYRTGGATLFRDPASWVERRRGSASGARYIVLIPARNAASTIAYSLRSAISQTVKPVAVAVLDDASPDDTLGEALAAIEAYNPVLAGKGVGEGFEYRVYRLSSGVSVLLVRFHRHTGKPGMVNAVLNGPMRGLGYDYVLILDSDTVIEGRYAEKILAAMRGEPGYSAANGVVLLWRPDRGGRLAWLIARAFRMVGTFILTLTIRVFETAAGSLGGLNGAALMVEKRLLERLGGLPSSTTAEDAELTWRAHLEGYRVGVVPDAFAYTVDPGSLAGLWRKFLRVSTGSIASALRLVPRLLARGRLLPLASMLYNSFGGIPVTLSLLHLSLLGIAAALGLHVSGLAARIVLALPYTPAAIVLAPLLSNPLVYLGLVYAMGVAESALLLAVVASMYRGNPRIKRYALGSLPYTTLLPVVFWLSALASLAALPIALYRLARGGLEARWEVPLSS